MTSIGYATLQIIPILDGVSRAIDSGTRNMKINAAVDVPDAEAAGSRAGQQIDSGLKGANVGQGVSAQISSNVTADGESIGSKLGGLISNGLKAAATSAGVLAAAGIGVALHAGFERLTAIDDAKFKLQSLGNSTEAVKSIMDNALASVKGTAFGLDEAGTTAASAVAAGIQPGQQLTQYLTTVAGAASVAGTSMADMGSIFNQVQTSGKAFTGDLNQLADRGLPVFKWLQDATGKTGAEFQSMVQSGGISAEMFEKAVADHVGGAATVMGGSIRGQLSNMKAAYSRFGAELATPLFSALSPLTTTITETFDKITTNIKPLTAKLTSIIQPWAEQLAKLITGWVDSGGVQRIFDFFGHLQSTISGLASGGSAGIMQTISSSVQDLGPALQQSGPALSSMAQAMGAFGQAVVAMGPTTISAILVPGMHALADVLKFVADNAGWAVPVIGGLVLVLGTAKTVVEGLSPVFSVLNGSLKLINTPMMLAQTAAIRAQTAAFSELSAALGVNSAAEAENATATEAGTASTISQRVAAVGSAIAQKATAAATALWTGAQWLLNAAMDANPIGIVVLAIAGLVAGIIYAYNHSETFRKIVQGAWEGIKTAVAAAWGWISTNVLPALKQAWDAIAAGALWLWHNAIQPAWEGIKVAFSVAWDYVKFVFDAWSFAFKVVGAAAVWLWHNAIEPAWEGIKTAFNVAWPILKGIFDLWKIEWKLVSDAATWLWQNVIVPVWDGIKAAFSAGWSVVKGIFDIWTGAWKLVGDAAMFLWHNAIEPVWEGIKSAFSAAWNFISPIFDKIKGGFDIVKSGILTAADAIGSGVKNAFSGLVEIIKAPLHALGSFLAAIPSSVLGIDVPGFSTIHNWGTSLQGLSEGGYTGNIGVAHAAGIVHGDEFVIKATSRRRIENAMPGLLDFLNAKGQLPMPGYAGGGQVTVDQVKKYVQQLSGGHYTLGGPPGPTNTDCSGAQSWVSNFITGASGRFATGSEAGELAKRGFHQGDPPSGTAAYWIGWLTGGPGGGHTAGTIVDPKGGDENVEMGGASGGGSVGGGAAGAKGFPNRAWIELLGANPNGGELPPGIGGPNGGPPGAATSTGSVGAAAGAGGGGFTLPTSFSGLAATGLSSLNLKTKVNDSSPERTLAIGDALAAGVSGQVSSALGVLGISDTPPILQAASTLLGGISVGGKPLLDFGSRSGAGPIAGQNPTGPGGVAGDPNQNVQGRTPGPDGGGATYNIQTATVQDAFLAAQQKEREAAAARLQRF